MFILSFIIIISKESTKSWEHATIKIKPWQEPAVLSNVWHKGYKQLQTKTLKVFFCLWLTPGGSVPKWLRSRYSTIKLFCQKTTTTTTFLHYWRLRYNDVCYIDSRVYTRFLWSVQSRNRCSPVANVIIPLGRRLLAREEGTGMKQTVSGWVLGQDPTHSHILGGHLYDEFGGEVWRWGQSIGQQIALNGMGVKACYAQ